MNRWLRGIALAGAVVQPLELLAGTCDGNLAWAVRADLGVPVSGVVASVTATPGIPVTAGHELVRLDPTPFEARLAAAKAEYDGTGAELQEQQRALARAEELYDRGVSSTVELDHSKLLLARARAAHQAAEAALKLAQYELQRSRLKAPFDGLVLATRAVPGQIVAGGLQPPVLVVLAKTGHYQVRCWTPGAALEQVHVGDRIDVSVRGASYAGAVQAVGLDSRQATPGEDTQFALDIALTVNENLPVGGRVTVELP